MRNSYILFMFALVLAQPETNAQTTPNLSAEEVLARYEQSLSAMRESVSFKTEQKTIVNGAFKYQPKTRIEKKIITRDGIRFGIMRENLNFDEQGNLIEHTELQSILTEDQLMSYDMDIGKPPKVLLIDGSMKSVEKLRQALGPNLGMGRLLDGIIFGGDDKSFVEVMRGASSLQLREEMEVVDGYPTYVLEADTKYGKHILWIDPEYGFNPRRIVIHKNIGDFYHKTKLGVPPPPLRPGLNAMIPWCARVRTELTVESIEIEKVGEVFVLVSAKITDHAEYENGQFTEVTTTCKRTDIDFNSDFEAMMEAFLSNIPDGTRVSFLDGRGISGVRYEWFNGKVRSKVDENFLADLDSKIEQLGNEAKAEFAETDKKMELSREESAIIPDMQTGTEEAEREVPEVLSESGSSPVLVLILIGLLIIGIIGLLVFRRLKA